MDQPVEESLGIREKVRIPCEASPPYAHPSLQPTAHDVMVTALTLAYLILLPFSCLLIERNVPVHIGHQGV